MYVCVCLAITQSEVEQSIEGGATSVAEVTRACRAGGDCGACHGMIEQMIEDHLDERRPLESEPQLIDASSLVRTRAA